MKRVVHITTVHPRDDIRIFRKECVSLARAGYAVTQIVGDGGGDALVQGVHIIDIGARPAGRLARMREQPPRALAAVWAEQPALVHVHDPELLPLATQLAHRGLPVVYDAHEDVPRQILTKQWIAAPLRPLVSRAFEWYENRRVRQLAAVCAATPHIGARFAPVAPRSVVVGNYPFADELAPALDVAVEREHAVCYVGGLMRTRGLLQMVRAVSRHPGLKFIVCGAFEDAALEAELRAEPGWAQVEYLGVVGREQVRQVLARARIGLVTLLPLPSYVDSLPIKMFEYMSAALPVVASDFALWRGIVEGDGSRPACGLCVDPAEVDAVAAAIGTLLADPARAAAMGEAGRAAVLSTYHWPVAERELLALYAALIGPPTAA
jgi:glycosyltransferase involved in cell wall biosynthesis